MKVTLDGGTMTYIDTPVVSTGNCAIGGFQSVADSDVDYVYLFTTDVEGDADSGFDTGQIEITYASPRDSTIVYVANVTASTNYFWTFGDDAAFTADIRTATFTDCDTTASTAGGMLILNGVGGGVEEPEPPAADPVVTYPKYRRRRH